MFQIQDMIRAYNFDIEQIEKNIIDKYDQPYEVKRDMREWYKSLIRMMHDNKTTEKGHIPLLNSIIQELESFHIRLLQKPDEFEYRELYSRVKNSIEALRFRSDNSETGEIELCFNGLYGLLMLRLMKKEINPETEEAFGSISEFISLLSRKFIEFENGQNEY